MSKLIRFYPGDLVKCVKPSKYTNFDLDFDKIYVVRFQPAASTGVELFGQTDQGRFYWHYSCDRFELVKRNKLSRLFFDL